MVGQRTAPPGEGQAQPDRRVDHGEQQGESGFEGPYRVVLPSVVGGPEAQPLGRVGAVEADGPYVGG